MLDAFGLGAQITPNPTELYDLAIVVNLDLVAGKHVAGFWNPLHLEDFHLDNPAILIPSNPGNPFCGAPDKLGESIHRLASELNTSIVIICHVIHPTHMVRNREAAGSAPLRGDRLHRRQSGRLLCGPGRHQAPPGWPLDPSTGAQLPASLAQQSKQRPAPERAAM